jgi:hypothetical protein
VAVRGDLLLLAMRDTSDGEAIESIRSASGKRIEPVLAAIQDFSNPFFSDAPVGQIFTKTAGDIPGPVYSAPKNNAVSTAVQGVLNDVQAGNTAPADAWDAAIAAAAEADAAA